MLMYTAPPRRAGVGALFRVHKNRAEPGPRPDLRSEMLIRRVCWPWLRGAGGKRRVKLGLSDSEATLRPGKQDN